MCETWWRCRAAHISMISMISITVAFMEEGVGFEVDCQYIYKNIYSIFTISHFWSHSGSQWLIKFIIQLKSLTITSTTLVWVSDCSSSSFARPLWNVIVLVLLVLLDLFHLLQRHLHPPIHTHTHTQRPAACVEKYRHPGGGSLSGSCCLRLGCSSLPDMDVSGLSVN